MAAISKEMTFNEVLRKYPQTGKVFKRFNMHCLGCLGAEAETVEMGAVAHGVDLAQLLRELNESLKG